MTPSEPVELSFEEALAELEALVATLEAGDLPLETSLETFERGVALVRLCHARLERAELRVRELEATPQGLVERPLDEDATG